MIHVEATPLGFFRKRLPSLRGDAFGEEQAAVGSTLPETPDRLIVRRIVPLTRLFNAVESDYHHEAFGRFALQSLHLAATNHVASAVGCHDLRRLLRILL